VDPPIDALLALCRAIRIPVVYRGADRADGVAVEIACVTYLPRDALVGRGECLVLDAVQY
jgi:hypothetical protein